MSELKDYISVLRKNRFLFFAVCLIFVSAAIFYTLSQKTAFEATATLYVSRTSEGPSDRYYTYEGYYSGQAAKEYTDVVIGFLKTPDLAIEGLKLADSKTGFGDFLASLKVRKVGPQLIGLSVTRSAGDDAKNLLTSLAKATTNKVNSLNGASDKSFTVSLILEEPYIGEIKPNLQLNAIIGLLGGLLVSLLLIAFKEYFKTT